MDNRTINHRKKRRSKNRLTTKIILISSISLAGILGNLLPSISPSAGQLTFAREVLAQSNRPTTQSRTFSLETIWRYAAALQEINPIREEHKEEINQLLQFNRPSRVCYQDNVPAEVKQSCNLFGSKMFNILRKHDVDEVYTPISIQVQSDESLRRKIQKAGVCQQRGISLKSCF